MTFWESLLVRGCNLPWTDISLQAWQHEGALSTLYTVNHALPLKNLPFSLPELIGRLSLGQDSWIMYMFYVILCISYNVINHYVMLLNITMFIKNYRVYFSAWKVIVFSFGLWFLCISPLVLFVIMSERKKFSHTNRLQLYFFSLFLEDNDILCVISITKYS